MSGSNGACDGATGQANGKKNDPPASHEVEIFRQLTPKMRLAYGQGPMLSRLASACWGDTLIDETVYDDVTNTNYEGEPKRAHVLVEKVYKKAKKSMAHLKTFAEIIKDVDSCHNDTAIEIGSFKTAKEFKPQVMRIADALQADISRIASRAMVKGLISYTEYLLVADPSTKHSDRCAIVLFRELDATFQTRPNPDQAVDKFFKVTLQKTDDISDFAGQYEKLKGRK